MSEIKILIVEDEPIYSSFLEMTIDQLGFELAGQTAFGKEAIQMAKEIQPDLILMDINIQGPLDGIEVGRIINEERITPIIFITSLRDDEVYNRAKKLYPHAFILKPFDSMALQRTIDLAVSRINELSEEDKEINKDLKESVVLLEDSLFIKHNRKLVKVRFNSILYIQVEEKYCSIKTIEDKRFLVRISLSEFLPRLTANFFRTHRKYAINLKHLDHIDLENYVVHIKGESIALSTSYKDILVEKLNTL